MSEDHDHHHHEPGHEHGHSHPAPKPSTPPPGGPEDSLPEDHGSQALAEALRSSFAIVKVVMGLLVFAFLCSGFFKVEQGQRAVVLHFGKPVGEGNKALLGPGLHWSYPYPIDDVKRIHYSQLQQVTSTTGWYNTTPEQEALDQYVGPQGQSINPAVDGYAITGDGNVIFTRATLIYRIEDPITYEFDFSNASNAVKNALDNAVLYAAARFKVDDILTREITAYQDLVRQRVTELVQQQNLGVAVEQCQVQSKPPAFLKAAFDSVLTALSERDKVHNDALSYQNQVLNKAESDAASRTNSAQVERVRLVANVQAEARRFTDLLPAYETNEPLFVSIYLNDTIGRVLTNVETKMYLPDEGNGKPTELRLQLSREPQKPASSQP
jgi:membrane protease subunit HflK